uniref:Cadherin domain-containing protein n=1 Tax=Aquila chrysaetos chrysaetos TaxID=223781 RepID=A0A663EW52_AQUCH
MACVETVVFAERFFLGKLCQSFQRTGRFFSRAVPGLRQVLCLSAFLSLPHARAEPIRYSVAEEGESGSVVANVAEDAGLAPAQLSARRARLASEDGRQHFRLDRGTGRLVVAERLDREELCGQSATCTLPFELLLANPLQFFRVEVAVEDINDHSPAFPEEQVTFKILETSNPGSRFPLEGARDLDVGSNSIQAYSIAPRNEYFSVSFGSRSEGDKYVELVLEKPLDREEEAEVGFSLIAVDGGSPPRSGTTQIRIVVLDVNDNAPVFTQKLYVGQVLENAAEGSVVLSVVATDRDAGPNGEVSYQFSQAVGQSHSSFAIDAVTGEIRLTKPLDFEAAENHELSVRATDGGGLSAMCKVLVEVVDVNDNAPEVVVSSFSSPLPENALPGTVVALFTVRDRDAGANGKISCALEDQLLFSLRPAYKNYYELVTVSTLDREETARYTLAVTAADAGSPPLTTTQTFTVDISDVNDNVPVFNQTSYTMYVRENNNNAAGALVLTVRAADADWGQNARVRYRLSEGRVRGAPLSSYVSVQAETGALYALRSFDYEEVREVGLWVRAEDGGAPALSSNVSVRLVIVDENDNAPQVLYPPPAPAPGAGWAGVELAPRSAEPGALVAKVVAVDADAGQNAWLSYELAKATEPGLFRVGLHSGEVRTARFPLARDAARQSLVVVVKDHGRPALSATATLTVVLAESVAELLSELGSAAAAAPGEPAGSLTRWLVVAVAAVSCLFLAFLLLLLALRLRRWRRSQLLAAGSGALRGVPASHFVGIDGVRAFLHSYSHEVSLTADSRKSQLRLSGGSCCDTLPARPPAEASGDLVPTGDHVAENGAFFLPNTEFYSESLSTKQASWKRLALFSPLQIFHHGLNRLLGLQEYN